MLLVWHDHPIVPDQAPAVSDPMGAPVHGDLQRNSPQAHRAAGLDNFPRAAAFAGRRWHRPAPASERVAPEGDDQNGRIVVSPGANGQTRATIEAGESVCRCAGGLAARPDRFADSPRGSLDP
jgi:hypothetical protein